ncbi:MAG: tetratricopeptide repeat protein [Bdellovibrionales bacterium]|nr:tetratricopeptide repeat protein [Bdellovibrionales bacterium]
MKNHTSSIFRLFALAALSAFMLIENGVAAPQNQAQEPVIGSSRSLELNEKATAAAQAGDLKKAETLLREAISDDTKNLTAAFNLASVYLQTNRGNEAVKLLQQYVSEYSEDAGLFARLGDAYYSTKRPADAINSYEKALSLDPSFPKISARVGTLYSISERFDDAIRMYLTAVEQEPRNSEYLANLSNLFLVANQPDKAISAAKRALQVAPTSQLYRTLGSAYEKIKDIDSSLIAYKRAQDLGDKSDELEDKISALRKVKG